MRQFRSVIGFIVLLFFCVNASAAKKVIGILVYDGVLTSDVVGPAEVFGAATKQSWFTDYEVKMISVKKQSHITTEEGLSLVVDSYINEPQSLSVLIVPSAYNMEPLLRNERLIDFIQRQSTKVEWLASNCSGAFLLAEAGLLNGKQATTWFGGEAGLRKQYPAVHVKDDQNYVVDGNIITSNGSVVSYVAAIKLLSLMSSKNLAEKVFESLQINRLVTSY